MRWSIAGYSRFLLLFVLVELVGIVRRVADDDGDVALVLPLDAFPVLVGQAKQPHLARVRGLKAHVVQRVHKDDVLKRLVRAHLLLVGVLDVEVGDVVGQDGHFVAVQFVFVFVRQLLGGESIRCISVINVPVPVAGSRISTPLSPSPLAEMLLAEMVGGFNHEAHDLVGRVDDAQPVGRFGVVRSCRSSRRAP